MCDRADVAELSVDRDLLFLSDAQRLVVLAALHQDVGDLALGDGDRADVAEIREDCQRLRQPVLGLHNVTPAEESMCPVGPQHGLVPRLLGVACQSLLEEGLLLVHLADAPRGLGCQPQQADAGWQTGCPNGRDALLGDCERALGVMLRMEKPAPTGICRAGEDLGRIVCNLGNVEEFQ